MNTVNELVKLMNLHWKCTPMTQGKYFINIKCGCDFEPHGRASETWELFWELELVGVIAHWRSLNGWKKCTTDKYMKFKGRTHTEVVNKAIMFIKECNEGFVWKQ